MTTRRVDIGLTGGIACGKSTVAGVFERLGAEILDADRLAHEAMAPGGPAYEPLLECFGRHILGAGGRIDRSRLAAIVFDDDAALDWLNRLVHPVVREVRTAWVAEQRARGKSTVVSIPLLFEVGATEGWSVIVCVTAREDVMVRRLMRRGLTDAQARKRMAAQWPVEEKAAQADFTIENNGTLDALEQRVTTIWNAIRDKE